MYEPFKAVPVVLVRRSVSQSRWFTMIPSASTSTSANCPNRQSATVEISREHSDYFVRNLAAILVEQREALVCYRPTAFLSGGFPFGS